MKLCKLIQIAELIISAETMLTKANANFPSLTMNNLTIAKNSPTLSQIN